MNENKAEHPDYTANDLDILNSGSWGFDSEDESSDSAAEASPASVEEYNPWDEEASEPTAEQEVQAENQLSRVELQPGGIKAAIEAILAVADVPISAREFSAALIVSERAIETALDQLYREYNGYDDGETVHEPRGFELRRIAGGWRLYARQDFSPWVGRFVGGAQSSKLSRAALETLAVIAYQQPATRSYVAQVRGVNVDAAIRNLKARGLITETVPDEKGITQFITTDALLEKLGLESLDQLPALAPYLPDVDQVASDPELTTT